MDDIIEVTDSVLTSRTYNVRDGRIIGFVDGLKAIEQAVEKLLKTERFEWSIYSEDYGVELSKFIGESYDFVAADIERTIEQALIVDTRIEGIQNFKVLKVNKNSLSCYFEVKTVEGLILKESEVVFE